MRLILYCLLFICASVRYVDSVDFVMHNHTQIIEILQKFSTLKHSKIRTRLYSIGNSVRGSELLVLEITAASSNRSEVPNVKLIGGMFGNQPAGTEILLHFIDHLILSYGKDENVTYLLNNTRLHILPCMNPDGKADKTKGNSRRIPLFKVFPDIYRKNKLRVQPESELIKEWMINTTFVLSASLNSDAKVVIYPYKTMEQFVIPPRASLTPDNDVFVYLSKVYSYNHSRMSKTNDCRKKGNYTDGIVNGAMFAHQDGTMQDYNYFTHGCMELDIRVSCNLTQSIASLWEENKNALVMYCLKANQGVYGVIRDASTGNPVKATFKVIGRDMDFHTNERGEFWKILLNGTYVIQVNAEGYYKRTETFEIATSDSFPKLKRLNIALIDSNISTTISVPTKTETDTINYQSSTDSEIYPPVVSSRLSAAIKPMLSPHLLLSILVTFLTSS